MWQRPGSIAQLVEQFPYKEPLRVTPVFTGAHWCLPERECQANEALSGLQASPYPSVCSRIRSHEGGDNQDQLAVHITTSSAPNSVRVWDGSDRRSATGYPLVPGSLTRKRHRQATPALTPRRVRCDQKW